MAKEFESRLSVMYVRDKYASPYLKAKYFYLSRKDLKTEKTFIKLLNERASIWQNGTFFLKLSSSKVFARFDVNNNKVKKLYKTSPITGEKYPIWEWFK